MEPREPDPKQIPPPRPDEKKRRFRIVKLEERIAPGIVGDSSASGTSFTGSYALSFQSGPHPSRH